MPQRAQHSQQPIVVAGAGHARGPEFAAYAGGHCFFHLIRISQIQQHIHMTRLIQPAPAHQIMAAQLVQIG